MHAFLSPVPLDDFNLGPDSLGQRLEEIQSTGKNVFSKVKRKI